MARILCRRFSSRPNGSGYPLSVPAVAHPPAPPSPDCKMLGGGRGRLNLPSVQHATQGSADIYIYIHMPAGNSFVP